MTIFNLVNCDDLKEWLDLIIECDSKCDETDQTCFILLTDANDAITRSVVTQEWMNDNKPLADLLKYRTVYCSDHPSIFYHQLPDDNKTEFLEEPIILDRSVMPCFVKKYKQEQLIKAHVETCLKNAHEAAMQKIDQMFLGAVRLETWDPINSPMLLPKCIAKALLHYETDQLSGHGTIYEKEMQTLVENLEAHL